MNVNNSPPPRRGTSAWEVEQQRYQILKQVEEVLETPVMILGILWFIFDDRPDPGSISVSQQPGALNLGHLRGRFCTAFYAFAKQAGISTPRLVRDVVAFYPRAAHEPTPAGRNPGAVGRKLQRSKIGDWAYAIPNLESLIPNKTITR